MVSVMLQDLVLVVCGLPDKFYTEYTLLSILGREGRKFVQLLTDPWDRTTDGD